jgi:hypothetical protein
MFRTVAASVVGGLSVFANLAMAQTPQPVDIATKATAIAEVSSQVQASGVILDGLKKVVIQGQYTLATWWLAASELEFKAGSSLVISSDVAKQSHEIFIIAKRITIDDPAHPPSITWETIVPSPPADRGQAGAGPHGAGAGGGGGNGTPGAPGATGTEGAPAPSLTLMFETLAPGPLLINFNGGQGGPGGVGQKGGDGGPGAQGSSASQAHDSGPFNTTIWHPWCASGPGQGGHGGTGGTGGPGGTGGRGGTGGSVTLVSIAEFLPTITQAVRVDVSGGTSGIPGAPGNGGNSGPGGPEGPLASFCNSAGRNGSPGGPGPAGGPGAPGSPGGSGRDYVSSLTAEQFTRLFGF